LKRFDLEIGICEKSVFEHKKMDKNDLELLRHYNVKQWNNEDFQDELILKYSKWVISKNRDMFLKGLGGGSFEIPEMYEFVFSGGKVHIEIGGGGYAGRKFKKNNDGSYDEEIIISRIYYTDHNNKYDSINVNATIAEASNAEYYFSKDNGKPDQQLIKVISGAKSNLDIAIYSLTKENIVDAIIKSKSSGVNVRLITDKQESKSKSEAKELAKLKAAGIPVKINTHKGLMHMKVTIADKNIITTGSYNYTEAATKNNDEVLVVLHDSTAAQKFTSEFERMWNDTKNFKEY
jgi:hypothetical protein